jgi:hypothetical protein
MADETFNHATALGLGPTDIEGIALREVAA